MDWVGEKLVTASAVAVDATGMGDKFAEDLANKYGEGRIKAYWFSVPVKEQLMTGLKVAMRTGKLRLRSDDMDLRRDVLSIRREIKQSGRITYEAKRTKEGHADRAWALALGVDVSTASLMGKLEVELHETRSTHRDMSDNF